MKRVNKEREVDFSGDCAANNQVEHKAPWLCIVSSLTSSHEKAFAVNSDIQNVQDAMSANVQMRLCKENVTTRAF